MFIEKLQNIGSFFSKAGVALVRRIPQVLTKIPKDMHALPDNLRTLRPHTRHIILNTITDPSVLSGFGNGVMLLFNSGLGASFTNFGAALVFAGFRADYEVHRILSDKVFDNSKQARSQLLIQGLFQLGSAGLAYHYHHNHLTTEVNALLASVTANVLLYFPQDKLRTFPKKASDFLGELSFIKQHDKNNWGRNLDRFVLEVATNPYAWCALAFIYAGKSMAALPFLAATMVLTAVKSLPHGDDILPNFLKSKESPVLALAFGCTVGFVEKSIESIYAFTAQHYAVTHDAAAHAALGGNVTNAVVMLLYTATCLSIYMNQKDDGVAEAVERWQVERPSEKLLSKADSGPPLK